jgi:hypothetical protein
MNQWSTVETDCGFVCSEKAKKKTDGCVSLLAKLVSIKYLTSHLHPQHGHMQFQKYITATDQWERSGEVYIPTHRGWLLPSCRKGNVDENSAEQKSPFHSQFFPNKAHCQNNAVIRSFVN